MRNSHFLGIKAIKRIGGKRCLNLKVTKLIRGGKPFDFILITTVLIMLLLGLVMVLSASAPSALAEDRGSYAYVRTQGISAVIRLGSYVFYI